GLIAPVLANEVGHQGVTQNITSDGGTAELAGVFLGNVPVISDFMVVKDHVGRNVGQQFSDVAACERRKAAQVIEVFFVLGFGIDVLRGWVPAIPGIGGLVCQMGFQGIVVSKCQSVFPAGPGEGKQV